MTERDRDDEVPRLANPFSEKPAEPSAPLPLVEPGAPQRTDRDALDPEATQLITPEPPPTEPLHPEPAPTELIRPEPDPDDAARLDAAPTELLAPDPGSRADSALDSLFGEDRFREYSPGVTGEVAVRPAPKPRAASQPHVASPGPVAVAATPGLTRVQRALLWAGGIAVAVLALVALFLLGMRLPAILAADPLPAGTPTPSPTPTPTAPATGPLPPGQHEWDDLRGGECLDPYTDPWAEEFTVVDCAQPHRAQMVYRGIFPEAAADPAIAFPGEAALQAQISILCSAAGVIDLAAASPYLDIQVQGSFPVTAEQWAEDPAYQCFVSRSGGEPLTTSVAVPPPAPAP